MAIETKREIATRVYIHKKTAAAMVPATVAATDLIAEIVMDSVLDSG